MSWKYTHRNFSEVTPGILSRDNPGVSSTTCTTYSLPCVAYKYTGGSPCETGISTDEGLMHYDVDYAREMSAVEILLSPGHPI
jgi:hypothetical protein